MALRDAGADVVVTDLAQVLRGSGIAFRVVTRRMRISTRRTRVFAKPCAPWEMAISRRAAPLPGRWRMISTIRGLPRRRLQRLRTDIAGRVVEKARIS